MRPRRASYLTLLALLAVVLLGVVAIAVDVSTLYLADAELQVAVDAAALAGASHLDRKPGAGDRAAASASAVAHANAVRSAPVEVSSADLELGVWDPQAGTFALSSDDGERNAVRVHRRLDGIPTPFAGAAFSSWFAAVDATATAVRPPPEPVQSTPCFLPIAISTCVAAQVEALDPAVHAFRFGPDSQDDIAWAYPDGVNASVVDGALQALASGVCVHGDDPIRVGDPIALQNGVVSSNLHTVRDLLQASATPWDGTKWGLKPAQDPDSVFQVTYYPDLGVLMGPIPVVDDGGTCAMRFNQAAPVHHVVWGVLFDEFSAGNRKGFQLFLDLEHEWIDPGGTGGGGSGNAVVWPAARLVE